MGPSSDGNRNPQAKSNAASLVYYCGRCGAAVQHGPPITCTACGAKRDSAREAWRMGEVGAWEVRVRGEVEKGEGLNQRRSRGSRTF